MARPPTHAPKALPMLKAAMLAPEARVGACAAWFMMRICIPGTVANPTPPMSTRAMTVATWFSAVSAKPARTTVRTTSRVMRVFGRFLSAARPPRMLPTNSPTPKRISSHGTAPGANPPTPVSVKAM